MITQKINLNLIPNGVMPRVNVSQYDYGSRTLEITLYNGSSLFTIPTGANVVIQGTKKDNRGFQYSNLEFSGSVVTADITQQMTVFEDEVQVELVIITGSGDNTQQLATANFILNVEPAALKSDIVVSETDIPVIQTLPEAMAEVEAAVEGAEAWAVGTKDGVPVTSEDEQYHNSAKYWAEQAAGGVTSFNGRSGSVSPADGDYNITQIAPTSGATEGQVVQIDSNGKFTVGNAPSSGHTIKDSTTMFTQRDNLKFTGAGVSVSDDSSGNATVVSISGSGASLLRADYEESPALYAHAIDDILYYNNKFYDVTSAIAIGDTLTVSSGLIEGNISERPGGMSYEVFDIPGGGSGGTVIADDVSYDNTSSGLTATNVQDAIDEVNSKNPKYTLVIPSGGSNNITLSGQHTYLVYTDAYTKPLIAFAVIGSTSNVVKILGDDAWNLSASGTTLTVSFSGIIDRTVWIVRMDA